MNLETLQQSVPSAFAVHPASTVSEKYGFISTTEIMSKMEASGYTLHKANQVKTRKAEWQGFQKHRLVFNAPIRHSERQMQVLVTNSHNTGSSVRFDIGVLEFICMNGMIRFNSHETTMFRHSLGNAKHWSELFDMFVPQFKETERLISTMQHTPMGMDKQLEFAELAIGLRWEDKKPGEYGVLPYQLLSSRSRGELIAPANVWNTLNNVQENLIRGRKRLFRPVRSINVDTTLNKRLWQLAESYVLVP